MFPAHAGMNRSKRGLTIQHIPNRNRVRFAQDSGGGSCLAHFLLNSALQFVETGPYSGMVPGREARSCIPVFMEGISLLIPDAGHDAEEQGRWVPYL